MVIETVYKPTGISFGKPVSLSLTATSNAEQNNKTKIYKGKSDSKNWLLPDRRRKNYVVFPGKEKGEILDLPVSIYLAQNQFVLLTNTTGSSMLSPIAE